MSLTAVEEAYSKWAECLTQYAAMLAGPDDAGDVFARLLAEPSRLDGLVDQRPYLYRSVLNGVRMRVRSQRRRARREWNSSATHEGVELLCDPSVIAAVRRLSVQQRAVTYLAYWEDLDVAAIAMTLEVGEGNGAATAGPVAIETAGGIGMNDRLDRRIHQLVTEVHDAAPLPPPLEQHAAQTIAEVTRSRRRVLTPVLAGVTLLIAALATVVVVRRDVDDNPAPSPGEQPTLSTATRSTTVASTPPDTTVLVVSAGSGDARVAISDVETDGRRCLRIDGVETPPAGSAILTCEGDVQPAGGPLARPGILAPRREDGTGRLVFVGLHDPGVATIVLRVDDGTFPLHRQVIDPVFWEPGDVGVALVALPDNVSRDATSFTTELFDSNGEMVSTASGTIPAD